MTTHVPDQQAPAPTCDCHFHIFGPFDQYPMIIEQRYTPLEAVIPTYLAPPNEPGS